jgi:class 3 adenylate cyclase
MDGVLAYFGYPRAPEDDAERAVRAGLEIAATVTRLETRGTELLAVRIGIATGLVIVGDLVGEGSAQEQAVIGETPNLAARLPALARPGTLVVADSTRRQLGTCSRSRISGPRSPSPMLRHDDHASCCRVRFRARFPRRADVPSTHAVTERSVRVVKRKSRSSSVSRRAAIVSSVISLRTNSRG